MSHNLEMLGQIFRFRFRFSICWLHRPLIFPVSCDLWKVCCSLFCVCDFLKCFIVSWSKFKMWALKCCRWIKNRWLLQNSLERNHVGLQIAKQNKCNTSNFPRDTDNWKTDIIPAKDPTWYPHSLVLGGIWSKNQSTLSLEMASQWQAKATHH